MCSDTATSPSALLSCLFVLIQSIQCCSADSSFCILTQECWAFSRCFSLNILEQICQVASTADSHHCCWWNRNSASLRPRLFSFSTGCECIWDNSTTVHLCVKSGTCYLCVPSFLRNNGIERKTRRCFLRRDNKWRQPRQSTCSPQ